MRGSPLPWYHRLTTPFNFNMDRLAYREKDRLLIVAFLRERERKREEKENSVDAPLGHIHPLKARDAAFHSFRFGVSLLLSESYCSFFFWRELGAREDGALSRSLECRL